MLTFSFRCVPLLFLSRRPCHILPPRQSPRIFFFYPSPPFFGMTLFKGVMTCRLPWAYSRVHPRPLPEEVLRTRDFSLGRKTIWFGWFSFLIYPTGSRIFWEVFSPTPPPPPPRPLFHRPKITPLLWISSVTSGCLSLRVLLFLFFLPALPPTKELFHTSFPPLRDFFKSPPPTGGGGHMLTDLKGGILSSYFPLFPLKFSHRTNRNLFP